MRGREYPEDNEGDAHDEGHIEHTQIPSLLGFDDGHLRVGLLRAASEGILP